MTLDEAGIRPKSNIVLERLISEVQNLQEVTKHYPDPRVELRREAVKQKT